MSTSLLAELQAAFPAEPRPTPPATPEQDADLLSTRSWPALSMDMTDATWSVVGNLPAAEFRYYLPAYLSQLLSAEANSHPRATAILALLTLPTELPRPLLLPATAGEPLLDPEEVTGQLRRLLNQTNARLHTFLQRTQLLTAAQARVIYRLLVYVRDKWAAGAEPHQAALAIQRYWFKFT